MLRWDNYFLKSDDGFNDFWGNYQKDKSPNILYIMGMGFDPRTNLGVKSVFSYKSDSIRDVIALRYYKNSEEVDDKPAASVLNHIKELEDFLTNQGYNKPTYKNILLRSGDDKSIASISSTNIITSIEDFNNYSDIVIDISAMPRGVFIPLINKSLNILENYNTINSIKKNLHVVVSENSRLDSIINDRGLDEESSYIHGFTLKEIARTVGQKEVWIPILGERQLDQFDKIKSKLNPVDICPVLPFPSENLRRGDSLIVEYQDKLFSDAEFEAKNIVYVDESNPFQVYRLINQIINRYNESFNLLEGCKIIISALSSKLLTLGAFLAAYEKKKEGTNVGIMHVESLGNDLDPSYEENKLDIDKHNKLFELWLTGEPYNEE